MGVYGNVYLIVYCVVIFAFTIGMFNVISAIFVESTMAASETMKQKQKKARLEDAELWATKVHSIVSKLIAIDGTLVPHRSQDLSDMVDSLYDADLSRDTMQLVGCDKDVRAALEDLDVDREVY